MGMYIRTISRKNKDGSVVRYIQLAQNRWDPGSRCAKAQVLYNFGREEEVDREALKRLVASINRFLGPEEMLKDAETSSNGTLRFISSRPLGGAWVLDQLWRELGIGDVISGLARKRKFQTLVERALFAMVVNRALEPSSKLAAEEWVNEDVVIPGLDEVAVQQLYRSMDFLLEAEKELQWQVYGSVAHIMNLEVDLLYFDTTSTYFETDQEDTLRKRGHSKDHRPDLPQAVIGLAVTREGIPVRCWIWPGNTADMSVVQQVKDDLVGWKLGRVITVMDRGFSSEDNLRYLQRAGGHYIAGEKMRSGKDNVQEALARAGRFKKVRDNLEVKEIIVGQGEKRTRYIVVRNPEEVKKDSLERERIIKKLKEDLKSVKDGQHVRSICELISHPTYGRYLKLDAKGRPHINHDKIKEEEKLDGKYLLTTSDDTLSPEDVALGYKQLLLVEDSFRTLKQSLELRPVYHRLEDRIRSHVLLCWLALLLIRVAENRTRQTWCNLRSTLQRMHLGEFAGEAGQVRQRTETTPAQHQVFRALKVTEPPIVFSITPVRNLVTRA
jgi:transposase